MTWQLIDGAAIWRLHAQDGFPVEMSLPALADRHTMPTWYELLAAARADGANMPRLVARIQEAIRDAYPPDVAAQVTARLQGLYERIDYTDAGKRVP